MKKKVFNLAVPAIGFLVALMGCTKDDEQIYDTKKYDVYVVGYEASGQEYNTYYGALYRFVAKLWKNGVAQNLTDGTRDAYATSVFVSGNDVYIAGYEASGQDNNSSGSQYRFVAKLWKNGVAQNLTEGARHTDAYARSVYISGSDVYVAGKEGNAAILWKNGVADTLFCTPPHDAYANSVFVSNGDVYVAGAKATFSSRYGATSAKFFKNSIEENLGEVSGDARSIFVSDGDVYMAGTNTNTFTNGSYPILWKNNVAQILTDGYSANSVFVSGDDVYVAGGGDGKAILWKNGVAQNLTERTQNIVARSVYVSGGDVFVAGEDNDKAILWKNGVTQNLTDGTRSAKATSIFVVKKK